MHSRIVSLVVAMCCIPVICALGATVTVSVVQNEKAPEVALEMSRTVEDELLGQFFDLGHIVSNSDISFKGSLFSQKNFGIKEAAFGMADYLVLVLLSYGPGERKNDETGMIYAELQKLSWRVVQVQDSAILDEKTIEYNDKTVKDFDPYAAVRVPARQIASDSISIMERNSQGGKR